MGIHRRTALGIITAAVAGGVVGAGTAPAVGSPLTEYDLFVRRIGFSRTSGFRQWRSFRSTRTQQAYGIDGWTAVAPVVLRDGPEPDAAVEWIELPADRWVNGRPTLWKRSFDDPARVSAVTWEHSVGRWPQLQPLELAVDDLDRALRMAPSVRLTVAERVSLPFVVPSLPAGFRLESVVETRRRPPRRPALTAMVTFTHPTGRLTITVESTDRDRRPSTSTVDGKPRQRVGDWAHNGLEVIDGGLFISIDLAGQLDRLGLPDGALDVYRRLGLRSYPTV